MEPNAMTKAKIGTFPVGFQNVDLFVSSSLQGGEFDLSSDETSLPSITIGLCLSGWEECVSVLLHETYELILLITGCRYFISGDHSRDTGNYVFHFDHPHFSDICGRAATFVVPAMPVLARAFRAYEKKQAAKAKAKAKSQSNKKEQQSCQVPSTTS
jgi:hypothetical protein